MRDDEFSNNSDDEIVDSIPRGAKQVNDDDTQQSVSNNNYENNYNRNFSENFRTKVIFETGPACLASKIAFCFSLASIIFCCFPTTSFIFALLGAGIGFICIASKYNGKIVSIFAIGLSILGALLAAFNGILLTLWHMLFGF